MIRFFQLVVCCYLLLSLALNADDEKSILLSNSVDMSWIYIPDLGCWVSKFEVTNQQYRCFRLGHSSGVYKGFNLNSDQQPVVYVSYDDAVEFAEWLGQKFPTYSFRIPTGKEWGFIAGGASKYRYPWGGSFPPKFGNYYDGGIPHETLKPIEEYDDGFVVSAPVQSSGEHHLGFFGLGGNVWEWTSEIDYQDRFVRGGSWMPYRLYPYVLRSSFKYSLNPEWVYHDVGFRLVMTKKTNASL